MRTKRPGARWIASAALLALAPALAGCCGFEPLVADVEGWTSERCAGLHWRDGATDVEVRVRALRELPIEVALHTPDPSPVAVTIDLDGPCSEPVVGAAEPPDGGEAVPIRPGDTVTVIPFDPALPHDVPRPADGDGAAQPAAVRRGTVLRLRCGGDSAVFLPGESVRYTLRFAAPGDGRPVAVPLHFTGVRGGSNALDLGLAAWQVPGAVRGAAEFGRFFSARWW